MPLVEEKNANKFTPEEQAELDAADQEQAGGDAPEVEEGGDEQPEPAPQEQQQKAAPQQDRGKPPPGFVPSGALEEERGRRKELAERMGRMEQTFQQLVLRQQQQSQPQPNGQAKQDQIPDYETDPIGHMRALLQNTQHELASLKGVTQQTRQEQEAYAQMQQSMSQYERHTQEFARATPDYTEAATFLRTMREKALNRFMSPAEVDQRIQYEEGLLAGKAMMEGKNPAQLFYEMAKDWGYKAKGSEPQESKLDRLKNGQKASASLSTSKGAGTPAGSADAMSLEALSELYKTDPVAADRMWDRMAKAGRL